MLENDFFILEDEFLIWNSFGISFWDPLAPFWDFLNPFWDLLDPFWNLLNPFRDLLDPFRNLLDPFRKRDCQQRCWKDKDNDDDDDDNDDDDLGAVSSCWAILFSPVLYFEYQRAQTTFHAKDSC